MDIKWNTGIPPHTGGYLTTRKDFKNGAKYVAYDVFIKTTKHEYWTCLMEEAEEVVAWCEIKNVQPFEYGDVRNVDVIKQALNDILGLTDPEGNKQIDIATIRVKAKDAIEYIQKYM